MDRSINMLDVEALIAQLQDEIEKAQFLLQDVEEDFFARILYGLEADNPQRLRMLLTIEARRNAARAALIGDVLNNMSRIIDSFLGQHNGPGTEATSI